MDKLKEQLAPVQKHLFWIGCGLIVAVTLYSWYSATSHLKTEQERLRSEIKTSFDAVNNIKPNHPNEITNKGMQGLMQETGEKVAARWSDLAKQQENVLVWPASVLDKQFIDRVNVLRPPELTVTDGVNEIGAEDKRVYRDLIEKFFPRLAAIVGAKWSGKVSASAGDGMGGMGGMMNMGADMMAQMMSAGPGAGGPGAGGRKAVDDSIVEWNAGNQSALATAHFGFVASEAALPSTRQILYAQEDLWVLENLLNIIRATNETNGKIAHRHEAAIKVIESIEIGREAVHESGKVAPVGKAAGGTGMDAAGSEPGMAPGGADMMQQMMSMGGGGMGGGEAPPGGESEPGGGGGGMPSPMGATAGASSNPADNRYVDRDYQGVLSSRLISAMQGKPEKPEDLFLAVAKRVPVRMVFKMDQRRVATLLAECANSKLPVEVRQVRINRQSASVGGAGGAGDMMGGMMSPGGDDGPGGDPSEMMAGMMGGMLGQSGRAVNPNRAAIADSSIDPYEVSIEIYGIVYIYNPVNRAVLGLPEETPPVSPTVTVTTTPTSTAPPVNTGAAAPAVATPAVN